MSCVSTRAHKPSACLYLGPRRTEAASVVAPEQPCDLLIMHSGASAGGAGPLGPERLQLVSRSRLGA